jgi:carboxyl-terminal processing protease
VSLERRSLLRPAASVRLVDLPGERLALAVRIRLFCSDSSRLLTAALRAGEALGVEGYLLDLRNCPGGVLEEAVSSAELMLPCHRPIAQTRRGGKAPEYVYTSCELPSGQFTKRASAPLAPSGARVAVLLNNASASAAEAFSSALRDNGRALLYGERSFGKARVQFFFPLEESGGLKLTVKSWAGPKGSSVEGRGLAPDVACRREDNVPKSEPVDACAAAALRYVAAR